MQDHISKPFDPQDLFELLVEWGGERRLHDKDIIEIGCGDGDFLKLLCKLGNNRGYGFDPSHVPDLDRTGAKNGITFIRDYYSEKYSDYKADLICCRHVLEHIATPQEWLTGVRRAIGHRRPIIYFEVPNGEWLLKTCSLWDVIYEHVTYWTPASMRRT